MVSNRREARVPGEGSHVGSDDFFVSPMPCPLFIAIHPMTSHLGTNIS